MFHYFVLQKEKRKVRCGDRQREDNRLEKEQNEFELTLKKNPFKKKHCHTCLPSGRDYTD